MRGARGDAPSRLERLRRSVARLTRAGVVALLPLLLLLILVTYLLPERQDDEAGYLELARNLGDGFYATGRPDALLDEDPSYPDLWFGPGLPLVLVAPVAAGLPLELVRLTGPLFLFGALLVFHAVLRRSLPRRAALAATWALGLYLPFYSVLPNLHSEPLAIFLVAVAMYALARLAVEDDRRWVFLGAFALAGLALTRVAYGWVLTIGLAAFLVWWLATRARFPGRLAVTAALALAFCVPWLAYTTVETGRLLQWGNSGALSLYWMSASAEGLHGDWRQADDVFTDPRLASERPFFASLRGVELPEQNARLEARALRNIAEHPDAYAGNVAANVSRLFFDAPYSDGETRSATLAFAVPNAILLALVATSLVLLRRRRTALPAVVLPFAVLAMLAFGLHALVAAYPRMLLPIVPLAVFFVATTLTAPRGRTRGAHATNQACR